MKIRDNPNDPDNRSRPKEVETIIHILTKDDSGITKKTYAVGEIKNADLTLVNFGNLAIVKSWLGVEITYTGKASEHAPINRHEMIFYLIFYFFFYN